MNATDTHVVQDTEVVSGIFRYFITQVLPEVRANGKPCYSMTIYVNSEGLWYEAHEIVTNDEFERLKELAAEIGDVKFAISQPQQGSTLSIILDNGRPPVPVFVLQGVSHNPPRR